LSSNDAPERQGAAAESRLPVHVAIIMDGNGRWAQKRMLSRILGHEKGSEAVRMVVRSCRELGIAYLTLYAFSTENWQRPQSEVDALMRLLRRFLKTELPEMLQNNIRLHVIGRTERLPFDVQKALNQAISATQANTALQLNLALSYGGRDEITRAAQTLAAEVQSGTIRIEDISEERLASRLDTRGIPDPDLLIRTGGDMRISNFLLWQLAYTEIFVTPILWPDFDREQFLKILDEFQTRERRFGRI
jgi:undecaprenyl diphosphate synthase